MSLQTSNIIRSQVDAIRAAANSDDHIQQLIKNDLQGFLDEEFRSTSLKDPVDQHSGSVHMCPWQTCQATRHGLDT